MEWQIRICCAEASDEVVLERAYGTFGVVATVDAWRNKLEGSGGVMEEIFERLTAFVVHDM